METEEDYKTYKEKSDSIKITRSFKNDEFINTESELIGKPLSKMRKAIAEVVTLSNKTIPHIYMGIEINMQPALEMRKLLMNEYIDRYNLKLTITHFIIKALGLAAYKNPIVNSIYKNDLLATYKDVNVGLIVSLNEGIIVPVLKNVNKKDLLQIVRESNLLIKKARTNSLLAEDLANSTITLSNIGGEDIDFFSAIIRPPEVTILAIGSIKKRPFINDNRVCVQSTMYVVASSDHRIVDGKILSIFLKDFKNLLESPSQLLK